MRILERDALTCQYCGRRAPAVDLHVDHIISVNDGGSSDDDNLITSCSDCNFGKGAQSYHDLLKRGMTHDEFRARYPQANSGDERHGLGRPRFLGSAIPAPAIPTDQIREERRQERVCRVLIRHRELLWSGLQRRVSRYGIRGTHLEVIVERLRAMGMIQITMAAGPPSRRRIVWIGPDTEEAE
jgi:hypothetical protein